QRQQIVFLTYTEHALEELLAVENSDSVQEHDQAGEADRANDLGFRREGANGEADKEHGADAKGEAEDVDLAHQIADADGKKCRQDRLAADDVASKIQHCPLPVFQNSQRALQPASRNCPMTLFTSSRLGGGVSKCL